jgi:imidazolonepropionase-like amidohydrolase
MLYRTTGPRTFTLLLLGIIAALFAAPAASAQEAPKPDAYSLLRCGTLLSIPGQPIQQNVTLIVKNGRVDSIQPGLDARPQLPAGATVTEVDLKDKFVLPGLIDCHVHLANHWDRTLRARVMTESPEFVTARATNYARLTLEAGFTTVRDLGSVPAQIALGLRDAVDQGYVVGPRIIAAGKSIAITGGHADPTNGYRTDLLRQPGPEDGVCNGPDECAKGVRHQIKLGVDVIKVTATGGVLSASTAGLAQHFTNAELEAIVTTAHAMGRKVAAHAHGVDGINAAIRAGVDSIEHGTYLDDQSIDLLRKRAASGPVCYHVPTLLAAQTVFENAQQPGYYLPMVARKALEVGPKAKDMFRKSHGAGIPIAFGTDTGVSPHGQNAREFKLMVEAGMTPAEAIVAATVTASKLLSLENELGTLEPGKAADVIAVGADPLKDVTELERVRFVMRNGAIIKQ